MGLTKQTAFEYLLDGSSAIQNAMNEYLSARDLIDDSIGFEVDLAVAMHADSLEFWWVMPSTGHLGQSLARLLELLQDVIGTAAPVGSQDILVDIEDVLFCFRNQEDLEAHDNSLVRAARSAKAFLTGLCLPASMLCWPCASSLSMARLSWVCS